MAAVYLPDLRAVYNEHCPFETEVHPDECGPYTDPKDGFCWVHGTWHKEQATPEGRRTRALEMMDEE